MLLLLEYLSICLFWTRYRRAAYTGIWSVVCSVGLQRLRQCFSLTYMYFRPFLSMSNDKQTKFFLHGSNSPQCNAGVKDDTSVPAMGPRLRPCCYSPEFSIVEVSTRPCCVASSSALQCSTKCCASMANDVWQGIPLCRNSVLCICML